MAATDRMDKIHRGSYRRGRGGSARATAGDVWLTAGGSVRKSSGGYISPPVSPRDALQRFWQKPQDRFSRSRCQSSDALGGQRERSPSPTYAESQDWWTQGADCDAAPAWKPRRSSRNFQNSEEWPLPTTENKKLATAGVANRENQSPSRFKKTVCELECNMKRRLRLDTTQMETVLEQRLQRRHAFPETATTHKQVCYSPRRSYNSPRGRNSPRGNPEPNHFVDVQHRTSAEMAASIMPEPNGESGAFQSMPPKYFVGNEIIDWRNHGRRVTRSPTKDCLQVGGVFCSPRTKSLANVHDLPSPAGSQSVRGGAAVSSGLSRAVSMQSGAMPVATKVMLDGQVHLIGDMSSPPSSLSKDQAFIHSGLSMVKFGKRSPGTFSPNAPRVPLAPVMSS